MSLFGRIYVAFHSLRKKYRVKHLGDAHPDKTMLVIKAQSESYDGLFGMVLTSFVMLTVADQRGLAPVIDGSNRPNLTDPDPVRGTTDPWEYYFEQPCGISLAEAMRCRNVLTAAKFYDPDTPAVDRSIYGGSSSYLGKLCEIYARWVRFNDETRRYLDDQMARIKIDDEPTVAVLSRGTDYKKLRPKGAFIQPEPEELIREAKDISAARGIDRIYLNTEETKVLELFRREFGDRLIYFDSVRYDDYNDAETDAVRGIDYSKQKGSYLGAYIDRSATRSKYELNLEYLRNIYAASRCTCLVAGNNSGSNAAVLMNGQKYLEKRILDTGSY